VVDRGNLVVARVGMSLLQSILLVSLAGCRDDLLRRIVRVQKIHQQRIAYNWGRQKDNKALVNPLTIGDVRATLGADPEIDTTVAQFKEILIRDSNGDQEYAGLVVERIGNEWANVQTTVTEGNHVRTPLGQCRIWIYWWREPLEVQEEVGGLFPRVQGPKLKASHYFLFDGDHLVAVGLFLRASNSQVSH